MSDNTKKAAEEIVEKVKELVKKGNVTKVTVSKNGEVIVNLPMTLGLVAGLAAPWAILLSAIVALGCDCSIDVIKEDGQVVHIA